MLSIITPNPDRTVYEVDAPPPVPNVGTTFEYKGKTIKNDAVTLPRGEAGDDYARLQERVASLEKRYEVDRFQLVTNFKSLETWLQRCTTVCPRSTSSQGGLVLSGCEE